MATPNGDFNEIREMMRNTQILLDQAGKVLVKHSESLDQAGKVLVKHSEMLVEHDKLMAEHDERMDRLGRHLEVLSTICDDLIRKKADRKKR